MSAVVAATGTQQEPAASCMQLRRAQPLGWAGFQLRGGGGSDTALWLDTPPKPSIDGPQNPTETDPRAPEVTRAQTSAKMEMGFLESAR